ncbi:MAG: peptidyl-prolyl cis-trans isomerase [Spirochaetia bacterium]|nr:peptidyl-prolyl cis-trans isomerase [Spirochaetia bacterium]
MKKIFLSFVMFVACFCAFGQDAMDSKVAIVNLGKPEIISRKQLDQTMKLLRANNINKSEQEVLEVMIEDCLLKQGAAQEGVTVTEAEVLSAIRKEVGADASVTDDQLKDAIQKQVRVSWETYLSKSQETLAIQKYIRKVKATKLSNVPAPTANEVQRFYDENSKQFFVPRTVSLDHIYVDTRSLNDAEKAKAKTRIEGYSAQLKKAPKDFDKLVELSDDSSSKYSHGEFGTLRIDDAKRRNFLGDSFFDSVFALKKGDISSVLTSNVGYHIVRVTETTEPRLLTLNETVSPNSKATVRDSVISYLTMQNQENVFKECVKELTAELKRKADIKYFL